MEQVDELIKLAFMTNIGFPSEIYGTIYSQHYYKWVDDIRIDSYRFAIFWLFCSLSRIKAKPEEGIIMIMLHLFFSLNSMLFWNRRKSTTFHATF